MEVTAPETRGVDATMVATQSRGYVELFLALGRALVAAGHRPREQRHSGSALREPEPTGYPRAPCGMSARPRLTPCREACPSLPTCDFGGLLSAAETLQLDRPIRAV